MRVVLTRSFTADGERYVAGDVCFVHPHGPSGRVRLERTETYLEGWQWGVFLPQREIDAFLQARPENKAKNGS